MVSKSIKIENKILEILGKCKELDAIAITDEVQGLAYDALSKYKEFDAIVITHELRGLTYDTISKYLKRMTKDGILIREGKGMKKNEPYWEDKRTPWSYYYRLRNYQR